MRRKIAKKRGLARYNTGKPCARGHIAYRYVCNGKCSECVSITDKGRSTRWRRARPEQKQKNATRNRLARGLPLPTRDAPDLCECCNKPPGQKSLALDHDHETGKFRGWLCGNCNLGIGKLGDNSHGIIRALNYLTLNT